MLSLSLLAEQGDCAVFAEKASAKFMLPASTRDCEPPAKLTRDVLLMLVKACMLRGLLGIVPTRASILGRSEVSIATGLSGLRTTLIVVIVEPTEMLSSNEEICLRRGLSGCLHGLLALLGEVKQDVGGLKMHPGFIIIFAVELEISTNLDALLPQAIACEDRVGVV